MSLYHFFILFPRTIQKLNRSTEFSEKMMPLRSALPGCTVVAAYNDPKARDPVTKYISWQARGLYAMIDVMRSRKSGAKLALRNLGDTVLALRKAVNLTQEELADAADLTSRYLQMLERGTANPSYLALRSLASALNVTLAQFIAQVDAV
jgi:DNA-binding XRE family transcriptional regulator